MAEKNYKSVEHRKVVVELRFKNPGPDFPANFKGQTLEQQLNHIVRKRLRRDIPG